LLELEAAALEPVEVPEPEPEPEADDARELLLPLAAPDDAALVAEVERVVPLPALVVETATLEDSAAADVEEPDTTDVELVQSVEPPVCTVTGAVCFTVPVWSRTLKTSEVP